MNTINTVLSLCTIASITKSRPKINVLMQNTFMTMLFDTGADVTLISEKQFRRIPVDKRPQKIERKNSLYSASGNKLNIIGNYMMDMDVMGVLTKHRVIVVKELQDGAIMGHDLMAKLDISWIPGTRRFVFNGHGKGWNKAQISMIEETTIKAMHTQPVRILVETDSRETPKTTDLIMTNVHINGNAGKFVRSDNGITTTNNTGVATILLQNCNTTDVAIPRDFVIGTAENITDAQIQPMDAEFLQQRIAAITENKAAKQPLDETRVKQLHELIEVDFPKEIEDRFWQIVYKHHRIFSTTKDQLGKCDTRSHKIHIKDTEPVYQKQFRLPETHQEELDKCVDEWLKLGIIQPTHSLYNSPIFMVEKKDGSLRPVQDFRRLNDHSHVDKY